MLHESLYINRNTALINYTKAFYRTAEELLSSESFSQYLDTFLNQYFYQNPENFKWLQRDLPLDEVKKDLIRLLKVLRVLNLDEISHPYLNQKERLLQVIEDCYHFWRNMQRISMIYTQNEEGLQLASFIEADIQYNQMILQFYRFLQEKIQGTTNQVYRQLQAGTNAALLLTRVKWKVPTEYKKLSHIPFINRIMLRTPLLIHPKSNKRTGMFTECKTNPIVEAYIHEDEWICYPCKAGRRLVFVYFHRDFTSSAVALANLFELAKEEEYIGKKPDCLVLFGMPDKKEETVFYYDNDNGLWVGKVSYGDKIEYFGYLKKMILTLHNLSVMEEGWLPLHGAMINLTLKDGRKKGIILIGDSGAGKSETIEVLTHLAKEEIISQQVVFDDMGSLHIEEGKLAAQGTEIGAFIRLDDLDKGSAYRDMDRSIFFNPESSNARVVIPASGYDVIIKNHPVDMFLYANNYTDKRGLYQFKTIEEAKRTFIEGKRFALGTTQENGLSSTYFANPFGPMQQQTQCEKILNMIFEQLNQEGVYVGEIYTCLGIENRGNDGLKEAAKALLERIKQ